MKHKSFIRFSVIIFISFILIGNVFTQSSQSKEIDGKFMIMNSELKEGVVPDELTAMKIADVILFSTYRKITKQDLVLTAHLTEEKVWVVESPLEDGKILTMEIRLVNGEIIKAYKTNHPNAAESDITNITLENGFIPNEQIAKEIAEIIWYPIYGEDIFSEKPFRAKLTDDKVWKVYGTLPEFWIGGTAYMEICQDNGKVLDIYHSK